MADDVYSPIPGRAIKEFLSVGKDPSYLLENGLTLMPLQRQNYMRLIHIGQD